MQHTHTCVAELQHRMANLRIQDLGFEVQFYLFTLDSSSSMHHFILMYRRFASLCSESSAQKVLQCVICAVFHLFCACAPLLLQGLGDVIQDEIDVLKPSSCFYLEIDLLYEPWVYCQATELALELASLSIAWRPECRGVSLSGKSQ